MNLMNISLLTLPDDQYQTTMTNIAKLLTPFMIILRVFKFIWSTTFIN
jgi:hypothetical protein